MTIVTLDADGQEVVHTKGSADVLLPLCIDEARHDGPDADGRRRGRAVILREAERMSSKALRVLAIAWRELDPRRHAGARAGCLEEHLTFLGLVGTIDPPGLA